MEPIATWEKLLLGVLVLLVLLWFFPGVRKLMGDSQQTQSDWSALILPISAVILFVLLLIAII